MDVEDWIVLSQQRIARAVLQEKDDLGTLIWLIWLLAALLGILLFLAVL